MYLTCPDIDNITAALHGLGMHVWVSSLESLEGVMLSLFIGGLSYYLTMILVNLSMLALYHRTFGVVRSARILLLISATIVLLWGLASVSYALTQVT